MDRVRVRCGPQRRHRRERAVRREPRVLDEHAAEVEAWYDGPEPDACRARTAILHARAAATRTGD